jgi:AcrR family transcriptional regulator
MAESTESTEPWQGRRPSRREEILDVFAEQVAARGYDAVSIREVAESVGLSKGTVIHHFGAKDKMLTEVHARYMQRRLAEARLALGALETPSEQLSGIVLLNLQAMHLDRAATIAFAREIVRFASEPVMEDVRKMRREYSGMLRDVLRRGMEAGDFRREDATMVSLQIFGMLNWSWTWRHQEGSWTTEELAATFMRTILAGIAADGDAVEIGLSKRVSDVVSAAIEEVASKPQGPAPAIVGEPS